MVQLITNYSIFCCENGLKQSSICIETGRELLCMCANNYLGLGDNHRLIEAAKRTYDEKGYGVASVRFICIETGRVENRVIGSEEIRNLFL